MTSKNKITEKKPNSIGSDAALVKLYLAREGDTWLNSKSAEFRALKKREIPDGIKSLTQEELLLDETARLDDDGYLRAIFTSNERDIHELVELPEGPDQVVEDRPSRSASTHSGSRRKRWCEH